MEKDFLEIQKNLRDFSDLLHSCGVEFWLEAGSALAAYRDGKIFPWEHDVDVGVWYEELDKIMCAVEKLRAQGYRVRVQKDFPYIDNIIQVYAPSLSDGREALPNQYDIYLYREWKDNAVMRWIHQPSGHFAKIRKIVFWSAKDFVSENLQRVVGWKKFVRSVPRSLRRFWFILVLRAHIATGHCIYHVHPLHFFRKLKTIEFYDVSFKIPADTEAFLAHRYGPNWRNPDPQFNQAGRWKKSEARKEMRLNCLPMPKLDFKLLIPR
ncbi:MAG: LicD family protein [bacterium]|nr:LicD family protein [bacterium]